MKIKLKIYQILVNRVPAIQRSYHAIRQQRKDRAGRLYAWIWLLGMNAASIFCRKRFERNYHYPDEGKKIPAGKSESALSLREAPEEFAERLSQYDVISFDVFDTLVFRPFSNPTDLFFIVGEKLKYLDFERIRKEMEWRARQKAKEQKDSYEVTLKEIYRELEEQAGILLMKGMQAEVEAELELCFGNPYMLEVFKHLKRSGKKIICTSDMYLSSAVIREMVEKCGFRGIENYFISCEYEKSKGDGALYELVRKALGSEKTYVHIGDHPVSDVEKAKAAGWHAELCQNVNIAGMPYRAEDMSIVTGSMYRGIVNAHIHNGLRVYSREYELGFIYGGFFVLGYCQWIHEYVKTHEIDKVLFLARDGDILNQVYVKLYPEESDEGRAEYVYWSRLAATKMAAGYYKYDYFRRFIDHKVNQNYTLEQIFTSMEIEEMLPVMCENLPSFMDELAVSDKVFGIDSAAFKDIQKESVISHESRLTDRNAWIIKEYLIAHWEEVLSHYEEQIEAGGVYYKKILNGCKRVATVDVGWAGSGAMALDHMINAVWGFDCEVIGLLAGTNSIHNAEPNMSEPQLRSGKLVSYLFSQGNNRDIWKFHDAAKGHNLIWEILLSSPQPSFKGFYMREGEVSLKWKAGGKNAKGIEELQQGIVDFISEYQGIKGKRRNVVEGCDVYAVGSILLYMVNVKERTCILKKFGFEKNVE